MASRIKMWSLERTIKSLVSNIKTDTGDSAFTRMHLGMTVIPIMTITTIVLSLIRS